MNNREEKPKIETEIDSFVIDICKDISLQPFSNTFHFEGENPAQTKLGEIFGIIKSNDQSEESAYLPNLLSQVVKREFFLKPNRGTEESFEAALNKLNLALADLAQHEVTSWIGNLDVVIGLIKGNELHFTKLGNGFILLSKNKSIVNVSKGLNEYEDVHPIKTFLDISSGELSLEDKLIFSTEKLFDSLSWEEITRHTKTFTPSEFDNILKSTLDIEGENVGTIIVNIKEKSVMPVPKKKQTSGLNFFGESKDLSTRTSLGKRCKSLKDLNKKDDQEEEKTASEKLISSLIPKKTQGGEIKQKEAKKEDSKEDKKEKSQNKKEKELKKKENIGTSPISPFEQQPELFIKEKEEEKEEEKFELKEVDDTTERNFNSVLSKAKRAMEDLKKSSISSEPLTLISKLKIKKPEDNIKDMSFDSSVSYVTEPTKEAKEKEILEVEKEKTREKKKKMRKNNEKIRIKEEAALEKSKQKQTSKSLREKLEETFNKIDFEGLLKKIKSFLLLAKQKLNELFSLLQKKLNPKDKARNEVLEGADFAIEETKTQEKISFKTRIKDLKGQLGKSASPVIEAIKQKDWEVGKKRVLRLSKKIKNQKKIWLILIVIFSIILLAFFLLRGDKKTENPTAIEPEQKIVEPTSVQLSNKVETTEIANLNGEVATLTGDKEELFAFTKEGKFFKLNITNNALEEVPLKNSVREIKKLVSMPTLRLIFLISEKDVFSYSPVMNRLTDVDIKIPDNISIGGAGVYLQYLYILDKNSRNIYQFPRKPGGFYSPKTRIANQEFFSSAVDLAVDDSLLVAAGNGEIQQYFEGKLKTSISAKGEETLEPKIVDIETTTDPDHIYALDSENGILLKISKENPDKKQLFFNEEFIGAEHFWINLKQDRAFVSTKEGKVLRANL